MSTTDGPGQNGPSKSGSQLDEPLLREKFRVAANKIKKDQTPGNKEDSDRNNKAVNSEKYHLKEGFFV